MAEDKVAKTVGVSFLDALDKLEQEVGGGNEFVGLVSLKIGWKVFITGKSNAETFFEFDPENDAERKAAYEKARTTLIENNILDKKPIPTFAFVMYKEHALGGVSEKWKDDQWYTIAMFALDYKEIVKPSLRANGLDKSDKLSIWCKLEETPTHDENRKTHDWKHKDRDTGEDVVTKVTNMVKYLSEIYSSEEEAKEKNSITDDTTSSSVPEGWEVADWDAVRPTIINEFVKATKDGKSMAVVAARLASDYAVSVDIVKNLVGLK